MNGVEVQEKVEATEVRSPVVTPVTTRDVLHRAADLLEEFGWCQRSGARDSKGSPISANHPDAVRFCLWGAIHRAHADFGGTERMSAVPPLYTAALKDNSCESVVWNNAPGRTRAEVVARLREAAEASDG